MLFHIDYEFAPQDRDGAQKRFKETGVPPPEGVTMQGRWHSAAGHIGFVIAESSDAVAIGKWMQNWTDLLSLEITSVLTDEEISEVIGSLKTPQIKYRVL